MFQHNIDPVLLSLGPLSIRWYGVIYALGFLIFLWYLNKYATELSKQQIEKLFTYEFLGVIIGARLGHVLLWEPSYFLANPLEILYVWQGGLAFHGALIGVAVATWLFCRKEKVSMYYIADMTVVPAALALAFGRIANFVNGELWGRVTDVAWCVEFPRAEGCRHPSQLYASLKNFTLFAILFSFARKGTLCGKKLLQGTLLWMFLVCYGLFRFIVEFFREPTLLTFGLSIGQYYSAIMFFIGIAMLVKWYVFRKKPTT